MFSILFINTKLTNKYLKHSLKILNLLCRVQKVIDPTCCHTVTLLKIVVGNSVPTLKVISA